MTATATPAHHRHRAPPRPDPSPHRIRPTYPALVAARFTAGRSARSTSLLAAALVAYVVIEIYSFRAAYPDDASRSALSLFERAPVARMLQGVPHGIDTAGGFAVWDGGWMMASLVAIWGMLASTRLQRGEEEDNRADVLLASPLTARSLAVGQLAVLVTVCALLTVAVLSTLFLMDETGAGATLFALAIGGFAACWIGVGAVAAQVFDTRRRALSLTAGMFGLAYLVRAVANSTDERGRWRRATPWGWFDEVEPYGAQRLTPVIALWGAGLALAAAAVALRGLRDTGGAFLTMSDRRRPRLRGLGGPAAFAWRENRGVLLAWTVGLAVWSWVIGTLLGTMMDWLAADASYQRILREMGMATLLTTDGYIGVMSVLLGLGMALYASWRIGAARGEEGSGRLELMLARPLTRRQWLIGHVVLTLIGAGVLGAASAAATWAGAQMSDSDLTLGSSVASCLNQLPVAALCIGLATLVLAIAPRLTLVLPAALIGVAYVVEMVGPALDWPTWILNCSPFHHLALVPAEPFEAVPAAVLTGIGLVAAVAGIEFFQRRDLVDA